jgi:hypothetical protein
MPKYDETHWHVWWPFAEAYNRQALMMNVEESIPTDPRTISKKSRARRRGTLHEG